MIRKNKKRERKRKEKKKKKIKREKKKHKCPTVCTTPTETEYWSPKPWDSPRPAGFRSRNNESIPLIAGTRGLIRLDPFGVENTVSMYCPCYHLRALAHASSLLDHDWPSTACLLTLESAGVCQIDFLLGGTSRGQSEIPLWR